MKPERFPPSVNLACDSSSRTSRQLSFPQELSSLRTRNFRGNLLVLLLDVRHLARFDDSVVSPVIVLSSGENWCDKVIKDGTNQQIREHLTLLTLLKEFAHRSFVATSLTLSLC